VGGGGELDRDLAAVLFVDEADQRLADQILRPGAEQFAQRAIGLLKAAEAVDQRDADRGVGEEALKALAREAERGLPFALGRQVAHDRTGAQPIPLADDALADPRVDRAPVAGLQDDLAALAALAAAAERVGGRGLRGWRLGEEIMQPRLPADDLLRGATEPFRQRVVDELKTPGAVDRIKADRRVVDEIDKLVALVADHRLHLMARGDVLEDPEAVARPAGDRVDRDVEPAG